MQGYLFSSGGEVGIENVVEAARTLLAVQRRPLVAYLPAASIQRRWVRETKAAFHGLARVGVVDPQRHTVEQMRAVLDQAAVLYIPGGNTYLMAHRLAQTPFPPPSKDTEFVGEWNLMAEIRQRILAGLPVIGVSAGAVLCGLDILTTNDLNCCGCTTFAGLGLLPFNLNMHYPSAEGPEREGRDDRLDDFLIFHPDRLVLALEDNACLHFQDGKVTLQRGNAWLLKKGSPRRQMNDLGALLSSAPYRKLQPVLNMRSAEPMKTLLILRHAKSSWDDHSQNDHERPLNKRGLETAPEMGKLLQKEGLLPDLVISSTALRARTTIELVAQASGYAGKIEFSQDLYAAPPAAYLHALAALPDDLQRVMVVGHNPGLEELVRDLTGKYGAMPTAALAQVNLPIRQWSELSGSIHGELVNIWRPKEL